MASANPLMEDSCELRFISKTQDHTMVRPYPGATKQRINTGDTIEVPKSLAKALLHDGENWEFVEPKKGAKDAK